MLIATLFVIAKKLDATQMSAKMRVDKLIVVFHKKEHYTTEKIELLIREHYNKQNNLDTTCYIQYDFFIWGSRTEKSNSLGKKSESGC